MPVLDIKVETIRKVYDITTPNSDEKIDISTQDQHGVKLFFKMNMSDEFYHLLFEYGRRSGHSFNIYKFVINGKRIGRYDTPKMLEMEQDDVIDVFIDYEGGNGNTENRRIYDISTPNKALAKKINISVQDQRGAKLFFRMNMNTLMEILMHEYSQRTGISFWNIRLFLDGRRIKRRETPQTLELEQNDIIDIFFEQTGGNGNTSPTEES